MSRVNWTQVAVFVGIVLVIAFAGIMILPILFGGYGGWGMMGPGMMGGWRQEGGWCPFCGGTGRYQGGFLGGLYGWLFMLLPLGFLVLLILGIIWLVRAVSRPASSTAATPQTCPQCGKPVAADWRVCPHCGSELQARQ
jgi:hypothetical protein